MTDHNTKYDVVIIGSGLGGLVCASILSREGRKVCVIEKNEQIGGSLQTFRREGVQFDTGVHYIGGLDKDQNLYQFFNYLGIMDRLKLERMDPSGFHVVIFKDDVQEYPYGMGYDNFIRVMTEHFPDDRQAINTYAEDIRMICECFPLYNIRKGDAYSDNIGLTKGTRQYLEELTPNHKLRNVLAGTSLLYAGTENTPLYIHALVVNSYIQSAWKCSEGGDQIANLLARSIKENGGVILRKSKVVKLRVEDEVVEYAELENGKRIYGQNFISNAPPAQTLAMTSSDKIRKTYRDRIAALENTVSVFVVYAIMKPASWKYRNRNYYSHDGNIWAETTYDENQWPTMYALFEGVPSQDQQCTETVTIMTYMRFDEVQKWANTVNTTLEENERGEEYEAFKKYKAERLLESVELKFPGFQDSIQSYYTSTPLSYRDYLGNDDGTLYGIVKNVNDPMRSTISPKTKVPNLLFTGQNVNLHGVLGVTVSAVRTCGILLGQDYLIDKIIAANKRDGSMVNT